MTALSKKLDLHRRALVKVASDGVKMRRELTAMAKRLKKLESEPRAVAAARKPSTKAMRAMSLSEPRWAKLF